MQAQEKTGAFKRTCSPRHSKESSQTPPSLQTCSSFDDDSNSPGTPLPIAARSSSGTMSKYPCSCPICHVEREDHVRQVNLRDFVHHVKSQEHVQYVDSKDQNQDGELEDQVTSVEAEHVQLVIPEDRANLDQVRYVEAETRIQHVTLAGKSG